MFDNLLNYYLKTTQTRINNRIEKINSERTILKASGDKRYKDLRAIKNTHLYENKPRIIKDIRESEASVLIKKLSITVAESLLENIKLKPDLKTASSRISDEIKMKINNLEFISLQELFWGFDGSFTEKDKFDFVLNLFLDLVNDMKYSALIYSILIDYVPFAKYIALENAIKEEPEIGSIVAPAYKNNNVDVFAESVFSFCSTSESNEMMLRFSQFLKTPFTYESKDENGRFLKKTVVVNFQNFEQAFSHVLSHLLEPLHNDKRYYSLGKRAYEITLDDFRIHLDLMDYSMSRSPESYYYYLTVSENSDIDVLSGLLKASEIYVDQLIYVQQEFNGNIEQLYFDSDVFTMNATPYFSLRRFDEFLNEMQSKQFDEYIEKTKQN